MMPADELRRIADRELACTVPPTAHRLAQGVLDLLDANAVLTTSLTAATDNLTQIIREASELRAVIAAHLPHPNGPIDTAPGDPDAWRTAMWSLGEMKRERDEAIAKAASFVVGSAAVIVGTEHLNQSAFDAGRESAVHEIAQLKAEIEEWRTKARYEYERMGG